MKLAQRNWEGFSTSKRNSSFTIDQATLLGGLAVLIFVYILFRFIYPLISKGVIF
jgi:hypothetical protein